MTVMQPQNEEFCVWALLVKRWIAINGVADEPHTKKKEYYTTRFNYVGVQCRNSKADSLQFEDKMSRKLCDGDADTNKAIEPTVVE